VDAAARLVTSHLTRVWSKLQEWLSRDRGVGREKWLAEQGGEVKLGSACIAKIWSVVDREMANTLSVIDELNVWLGENISGAVTEAWIPQSWLQKLTEAESEAAALRQANEELRQQLEKYASAQQHEQGAVLS